MNNKSIRCSILMTSYNGEKYIFEQIQSILSAMGESDELIISDDGSSDRTLQIIDEFKKRDNRITLLDGPHKGLNKNIEFLNQYAKGEFVFWADQDDIWDKEKINIILDLFMNNENISIIHHNSILVDSSGNSLGYNIYDVVKFRIGTLKNLIKPHFYGSMMAFRRSVLDYYHIPSYNGHDIGMGLLGCKLKNILFIDDCLMKYRRHENNVSSMGKRKKIKIIKSRFHFYVYFLRYVLWKKNKHDSKI